MKEPLSIARYNLCGFCEYHGRRDGTGHYTATARSPETGAWYNYDAHCNKNKTNKKKSNDNEKYSIENIMEQYEIRRCITILLSNN